MIGRGRVLVLVLVGCGGSGEATTDLPVSDTGVEILGRCDYTNPFSQRGECREYTGAGWDADAAASDCAAPVPGAEGGTFVAAARCAREDTLGDCVVAAGEPLEAVTVFPGTDPSWCAGAELGCSFSAGDFEPSPVCAEPEPEGVAPGDAFIPFQQVCVPPRAGEPPGAGPDGQVCTWEAISASTEPGRRYVDYASCAPVYTQRPYYPYPPADVSVVDDARLDDPAYVAELAWVTSEVEASACVCCHSAAVAPDGTSGWYLEDGPVWLDGTSDAGLAMLAGWVDSTAFGTFPADANNGFDRSVTGLPTSDVPRMVAFLEAELGRRGRTRADFADTPPFGGVLVEQLTYAPPPCEEGQGIDADGVVRWTGGPARYLYVLEADAMSPGVPPNLDLPEGTLWRVDVAPTAEPVPSGVRYGDTPAGAQVVWPASGEAPPLTSGRSYYLAALLDVYLPATRCVFVAP